jgi:antirestriction protein ArdC
MGATGAVIRHGGDSAYYSPKLDIIQLPVPEAFRDAEGYAATKVHESTHRVAESYVGSLNPCRASSFQVPSCFCHS